MDLLGLIFEESLTDPKDVRKGDYIKVESNGSMVTARVMDISSVKNGKHGSAKTALNSKIISTDSFYQLTHTSNDMVVVCRPTKTTLKLIDVEERDGTPIGSYIGIDNNVQEIDFARIMSAEHIKDLMKALKDFDSSKNDIVLKLKAFSDICLLDGTEYVPTDA
ncbi:hypothetical protein HK407_02g04670 [Ordospora pajunii]|uniref:uncharacterized protein n=1 Tax=Ordospora pajunii TaxID=3039483 RepID=UPI0029528924|nr:uncharacterized protein HK407_02g04670 [Ordospora pajunii]KAH9412019.1 hypothetical protein HK407_02g04670 [Ordospora pajunii]